MNEQKVLLVTGASKGIGLEIVLHGLDKGYHVAATSRNAKKLTEAVAAARPGKTGQFLAVAALRAKLSQVRAESDRMLSLSLSTDRL